MRLRIISISFVALSLCLIACSKHYDVASLDAGNNRTIVISSDRVYDNTQPVYYEIEVNGRSVVPRTFISSEEPDSVQALRLRLLSNKDRSIVGVIDEKLPQKLFCLHNFTTGETWPRCQSGGTERCEETGKALLKELQKDHPEVTLVL